MAILGTEGCSSPDLQQPNSLCKLSCLPQHCPLGYEGMASVRQQLLRFFPLCCGMTATFVFKRRNGECVQIGTETCAFAFWKCLWFACWPSKEDSDSSIQPPSVSLPAASLHDAEEGHEAGPAPNPAWGCCAWPREQRRSGCLSCFLSIVTQK